MRGGEVAVVAMRGEEALVGRVVAGDDVALDAGDAEMEGAADLRQENLRFLGANDALPAAAGQGG